MGEPESTVEYIPANPIALAVLVGELASALRRMLEPCSAMELGNRDESAREALRKVALLEQPMMYVRSSR